MILDFLNASPARIQALAAGFLAVAVLCLGLTCWALWERLSATQARAERDRALAQVAVVSEAARACTASVDRAQVLSQAAVDAIDELLAAARRHSATAKRTSAALEAILSGPVATQQASDCGWAWEQIEQQHRKAGAP